MPNFEAPPNPQQERPSAPEKRSEAAKEVISELNDFLRRWRKAHTLAVVFVGVTNVEGAVGSQESRPENEVTMDAQELRELDPEATPERVQLILETLPAGFVQGEVAEIGFEDEPYVSSRPDGMPEGSITLGTATGGTRAERTVITFWKGMKGRPSEEIWNDTIIHEVAHANDWNSDRQAEAFERTGLKAQVAIRVMSEDRFRSAYVEAINNPDPAVQLEIKSTEYWAEIVTQYLNGGDLPEADAALVKEFIASQDPTFDRDAALAKRRDVIGRMTYEEGLKEFEEVSAADRASVLDWVEARATKGRVEELDAAAQREGRLELVTYLRERVKAEGQQIPVEALLEYYKAREALLEARQDEDPRNASRDAAALRRMGQAIEGLKRAQEIADDEALETMAGAAAIVEEHDLVLGRHRGARLELGESKELYPNGPSSDEDEWLSTAVSWESSDSEYDLTGIELLVQHMEWEDQDRTGGSDDPVPGAIKREDE